MKDCRAITECRACKSTELESVFNLGMQPLANRFKLTSDEKETRFPLEVLLCSNCSLAQLSVVVNPETLYQDYAYVTQKGSTMTAHLEQLLKDFEPSIKGRKVLEIGSNDGHFLRMMIKSGASLACGYEPCGDLALTASQLGSPTMAHAFNSKTACLVENKFDTVFARHVFAHVDDWHDFFKGLETVTHEYSEVHIEVPDLLCQFKAISFDQIYHEHLYYINIASFKAFAESVGWGLEDVKHYPIHGGSMMLTLVRKTSLEKRPWGKEIVPHAIDYPQSWRRFEAESRIAIQNLKSFIEEAHKEGKTIYGYGASAKSTVFLNAMNLPDGAIKAMCDSTPQKQGNVCPGTSIVVVPESELLLAQPDYAIIFAWNYSREIMEKNKYFKGKWVIPLPELTIV